MKPKAFRIHFNHINMQRGNPNVWTIHTNGQCIQVKGFTCFVPVETRYNPTGRQPRAYLWGKGIVEVFKNSAVIGD